MRVVRIRKREVFYMLFDLKQEPPFTLAKKVYVVNVNDGTLCGEGDLGGKRGRAGGAVAVARILNGHQILFKERRAADSYSFKPFPKISFQAHMLTLPKSITRYYNIRLYMICQYSVIRFGIIYEEILLFGGMR